MVATFFIYNVIIFTNTTIYVKVHKTVQNLVSPRKTRKRASRRSWFKTLKACVNEKKVKILSLKHSDLPLCYEKTSKINLPVRKKVVSLHPLSTKGARLLGEGERNLKQMRQEIACVTIRLPRGAGCMTRTSQEGKTNKQFLQWRVWSWLRMNASGRPNTCKSRGSAVWQHTGGDRRMGA